MRVRALLVPTTIGAVLVAGVMLPASPAVAAKKKTYKVSAKASAASVKTSHNVTISGSVTPKSRATVKLQRYSGGKWTTIASKKLPKSSKYSFTTNVGKTATNLSYRVSKAKTKKVKAGVSKTVKVKVVTWGTVKSWGENGDGQLGNGVTLGTDSPKPVNVKGLTEVVQVAAESNAGTAFALRYDGTVYGWGYNGDGQLGTATAAGESFAPVKINGISGVKRVAGSNYNGYALKKDGTVWAWGDNNSGQLGNDKMGVDSKTPVKVSGLSNVVAIDTGYETAYALKSDGTVWAWGYGGNADLGQGGSNTDDSDVPLKVTGLPKISQIAGCGDTGYAVGPYGTVYAWGYNSNGELGNGTDTAPVTTPVQVAGLSGVTRIGQSAFDTGYATAAGGTVWAWGKGGSGQLGDGKAAQSTFPVRVAGLAGVKATAGTDSTGFALMADRTVRSWGAFEATGDGSLTNRLTPVKIPGLANVTGLAGGYETGYAVIG